MVSKLKAITILFLLEIITVVTCACIGGYQQPNRDIGIIKVTGSGSEEWCTMIDSYEDDYAESIIQTSDRGYAIAGTMALKGAVDPHPRLIKLTSNGTIEWDQIYTHLEDRLNKAIQTPDGGFIGLTYHRNLLLKIGSTGVFTSQIDSNLTEQYFPPHIINIPNTSTRIDCPVVQISNDFFVFACFTWDSVYNSGYGFDGKPVTLLFMNNSGIITNKVTISSTGTWNDIINLIPTYDGGYAILVTRSSWERDVNPYPKRCDDPAPPPPK